MQLPHLQPYITRPKKVNFPSAGILCHLIQLLLKMALVHFIFRSASHPKFSTSGTSWWRFVTSSTSTRSGSFFCSIRFSAWPRRSFRRQKISNRFSGRSPVSRLEIRRSCTSSTGPAASWPPVLTWWEPLLACQRGYHSYLSVCWLKAYSFK